MAIPDFYSFLLPVLQVLNEATGDLTMVVIRERTAARMQLSEADKQEMLPSGRQTRLANRVAWAAIYFAEAGLATWVKRGVYRISDQGRQVALSPPSRIDRAFLTRFPKFMAWQTGSSAPEAPDGGDAQAATVVMTPEEQIQGAYEALRRTLEREILQRILTATPRFFEELVVDLLVKMGYGGSRHDAGKALGRTGDGGLDGIIKEDRLGLDAVFVQAKRWDPSRTVGRPEVQAFAGSLEGERARKGVFVTTSTFSREAREYIQRIDKRVVLVDGEMLVSLMFDHGVGVRLKESYEIKEVDEDYFSED